MTCLTMHRIHFNEVKIFNRGGHYKKQIIKEAIEIENFQQEEKKKKYKIKNKMLNKMYRLQTIDTAEFK